jgi:large subunit ribosomal protein L6
MSRIGRKQIKIPDGVVVEVKGKVVKTTGPKGELQREVRPEIAVRVEEDAVFVEVKKNTKNSSAYWGLTRSLIANMIDGVSEGYEESLELIGVGYRAKLSDGGISMSLGFSHPVEYKAPEGIKLEVPDNTNILVKGIDKQLVGHTAAVIRNFRKPEPYKGKGIRYKGEVVKRKPGKAGKTTGA